MAPQRHFLLVDDDDSLRAVLAEKLTNSPDCTVTQVGTIAAGLAAVADGARCDAVILNLMLPDGDCRDMCVKLRRFGLRVPILVLTEAWREAAVIRVLEVGANDFLVKPFHFSELLARLHIQLRAFEASEHAEIMIGRYIFRPGTKTLQPPGCGRPIRLTPKEAALLRFLYRSEGAPVSREVLLHEVWGYSASASSHTVETHIYRLRRKLARDPETQQLLLKGRGGYRLRIGQSEMQLPVGRLRPSTSDLLFVQ